MACCILIASLFAGMLAVKAKIFGITENAALEWRPERTIPHA
jgi:urease accessory protein UreH